MRGEIFAWVFIKEISINSDTKLTTNFGGGDEMKVGKKIQSRIEEFCKGSSELLQSIHVRCGDLESDSSDGQTKKGRKKRKKKTSQ